MHRWTARFLLLVMLVPAFGTLALARATAPEAMHCARHPLGQSAHATEADMPCHHGMAMAPQAESPATSFSAVNSCCDDHNCCRGLKTSEWARPAAALLKLVDLLIEPAAPQRPATRVSADLVKQDAARAPPRS
jgi:hypothetical protein